MNRDDIKEFLELAAGLKKSSRMLAEAEDDEEEGTEEEGTEEEGAEEESEEDSDEDVKVSKDEEIELSKSLDDSLTALFVDIETDALKSAAVQKQEESYSLRAALLNESEAPDLDIEKFAAETARIIKNADVLLDIEEIIMAKARDYLLSKYDEDAESSFLEIMKTRFHVDPRDDHEKEQAQRELPTPIAVGAGGGDGGGG